MVKRVLCYGNSNTWGYIPGTGERLDYDSRWTGIMARLLKKEYQIIEEGLNGRTIAWDDPTHPGRNGMKYLLPCLETHRPLDMVIVLLGTNDLKNYFHGSVQDIVINMEKMIRLIKDVQCSFNGIPPQILLLSIPYVLKNNLPNSPFQNARDKSIQLASEYQGVALKNRCHFLDISSSVKTSPIDGVHLNQENHQILAQLLIKKIKEIDKNLP